MSVMRNKARSARFRSHYAYWTAILSLCTAASAQERRLPVKVTRIDGTSLEAHWSACCENGAVRLERDDGPVVLSLDELSSIRFPNPIEPSTSVAVFHLADGGRLLGELIGGGGDSLTARTILGDELRLPFSSLAGVRLIASQGAEKSAELFESSLSSRLPGQDVLVTRGPEEVKALRGRLENLGPVSGSFVFAEKSRTFQNDKIFGVVFAAGVARDAVFPVTVELVDGSAFSGSMETADGDRLRVAASFGGSIELPAERVHRLQFRSPRVTYLSDIPVAAERVEGRLHRPWPVRRDRNVANGPLSLDGRVFDKGLGVHSHTELDFDLLAQYEAFVATIGIDDSVRPLGVVEFRVLGDGRELFQSGIVTGDDPPKDIRVEVGGVRKLTLVVDYADGVDLSDQADWGGARLLKAGSRRE